jgi:hypothetical protein
MKMSKPCYACETGTVRLAQVHGRAFDYRDEVGLVVDEDIQLPVCDTCGEMPLNAAATKRLNVVLERLRAERKQSAVKRFIETVGREYPTVPRAAWEQALGLSPGYLSRLVSGNRLADTPLEILLAGFAKNPGVVIDLIEATGHMPKQLMAHLARAKSPRRRVRPA